MHITTSRSKLVQEISCICNEQSGGMDQDAANEDIAQMAKTDGSTEILCTSRHKGSSKNYIIADRGGGISLNDYSITQGGPGKVLH